jgi:hypothetical protein
MKKVAITARAASFVEEWAKWFETEKGLGYVPAIVRQVTDSSNPDFVPQLTLGFEKREAIDRSRVMECGVRRKRNRDLPIRIRRVVWNGRQEVN